jgi:tetraacyldisaccharide 4'-kinase
VTKKDFHYIDENTEVLLVTGIANPRPLKHFLEERIHSYHMMQYNDHHIFLIDDWKDIKKRFEAIEADKKIILTTEKDATRLVKFGSEVDGMPFYVLPIEHRFMFGQETDFTDEVSKFILNFKLPA